MKPNKFIEKENMNISNRIKKTSVLVIVLATILIFEKSQFGVESRVQSDEQTSKRSSFPYSPVIFVPGDGGSQLEAKLNKTTRVHPFCKLVSDWFGIWVNIHLFVPMEVDCLADNMRLHYDKVSRSTRNTPGVQIRPVNFGSLDSVDYLDAYRIAKTDYFETIIRIIEENHGLIRNVDMLGAPFDFRKAPNELNVFFKNLTELIEKTYVQNNYKPVTLICHSMGCLNSVYLLNGKTQKWKDVYIRRLITLAAPWDGSFKAISALLFGDNLGIPLLPKVKLQQIQSSFPSLMYLFPRMPTFDENRLLVQTPSFNYTLKDMDKLFKDAAMIDQMEMWHDTQTIASSLEAPNVEIWCLYGQGISTPSQIVFQDELRGKKYKEIQGDGDGTVNIESLRACERFKESQTKTVSTRQFKNVTHISILRGREVAEFISEYILDEDSTTDNIY